MNNPWDLNEVQRRQFREAHAESAANKAFGPPHSRPVIGCTACEATYNGDPGQWQGCAVTRPRCEYQVIYRFGSTEVADIRTYETREEAEAEARAADDEGLDETWIEEVPPS